MPSEFIFDGVSRKLNVTTLKPSFLGKVFKLEESSLILIDQSGNGSVVVDGSFDPPLSDGNVYSIEGNKLSELVDQMSLVKIRERDVAPLEGSNRDYLIMDLIQSTGHLGDRVNMLYHGPQAVVLIQIIAILASATKDFSLITPDISKEIFLRLEIPTSFKASLYQVAANMADAFRVADRAMSTISQVLLDLPEYLVTVIEVFEQGDNVKAQKILARTLEKIEKASKKCIEQANKANSAFDEVIKDIKVMTTAAINSQGITGKRLEELEKQRDKLQKLQESLEKSAKGLENRYQEAARCAEEARTEYKDFIKNSGSMGKMFLATFADASLSTLKTVALADLIPGTAGGAWRSTISAVVKQLPEILPFEKIVKSSPAFQYALEDGMIEALNKISNDLSRAGEPLDQETVRSHMAALDHYKESTAKTDESQELLSMVLRTRKFLQQHGDNLKDDAVKQEIERLRASIGQLVLICSKAREERKQEKERAKVAELSLREAVIKAETKKIEISQEQYKNESVKEETLRKELKQSREELTDIVTRLQNLDTEKADFGEIQEYLFEGIEYLGKIQRNWAHLAHFFEGIQLVIQENLKQYVDDFVEEAKDQTSRRLMLRSALKATTFCIQVANCAHIYTSVSAKFVMGPINGIGEQFALTPEKARAEQMRMKTLLQNSDDGVRELIDREWQKLNGTVEKRLIKYSEILAQSISYPNVRPALEE